MATTVERGTVAEHGLSEQWGIEPVPVEKRTLSGLDLAVLWGDLGIGLLVLVTGALLVPALGFGVAMVAIVLGSLIGVGLLASGAAAGARHGIPTMVLLRPVLGVRGSWLPTAFNVIQLVGWTAVELWAMSYVADIVSERVFGFSARWLWLSIAGIVCCGLALWGPVGVTRVWMERFGVWVIGGISVLVTIAVLTSDGIVSAIAAPGAGGFPTFGPALDLVIAMPVSWFPLVADYTRFGARPRSAFAGTFIGYLIANVWLYALGALLVLAGTTTPDPAGIAIGLLAIAGGSVVGILFLIGLLVGETDEAFADIYSGAVSLQNLLPRVPQKALIVGITLVGAGLAALLTMQLYESFLFLIGSVFVPLMGVVIADHFVIRRGRLEVDELYERRGRYWFGGGVRWQALVPWVAGFLAYHWISPSPVDWWMRLTTGLLGDPLSVQFSWLSASIPSFLVALVLGLVVLRDISSESLDEPATHQQRGDR
ncbi:MAG TPA: cytosine permease [Actinomycetota bacterium]|nr:cytosine permease [Actinomycetota bacterium]